MLVDMDVCDAIVEKVNALYMKLQGADPHDILMVTAPDLRAVVTKELENTRLSTTTIPNISEKTTIDYVAMSRNEMLDAVGIDPEKWLQRSVR